MSGFRERFDALCRSRGAELGRKLLYAEVMELGERAHNESLPKKKTAMTDEEWIQSLEGEAHLNAVNVRSEISRAQFWCKQNRRIATRRFIVNWLNKAVGDAELKMNGAQSVNGKLKLPPPAGPEGWREWLEMKMPPDDHPAHGQLLTAFNCRTFSTMPGSWQAKCIAELAAGNWTAPLKEVEQERRLRNA